MRGMLARPLLKVGTIEKICASKNVGKFKLFEFLMLECHEIFEVVSE